MKGRKGKGSERRNVKKELRPNEGNKRKEWNEGMKEIREEKDRKNEVRLWREDEMKERMDEGKFICLF